MKFGSREICDVTFKATANGQKIGTKTFKAGQPCFGIDTGRTSSLEQGTTTVYAQGGKGYTRLIAWEGEKTMTFTIEDALISPMGLAVLSGAGLIKNGGKAGHTHAHITTTANVDANGVAKVDLSALQDETGLTEKTQQGSIVAKTSFNVCKTTDVPAYATVLDGSGAGIDFVDNITITGQTSEEFADAILVDANHDATFTLANNEDYEGVGKQFANKTVQLDFYVILTQGVTEIEIKPGDFGGFFYIEASTLFRREDTGLDMAAEIIIPKAKVQSGFTFSMAATGDPSTFTFTLDCFPGYTQFDKTVKRMCVLQVLGSDEDAAQESGTHTDHKLSV